MAAQIKWLRKLFRLPVHKDTVMGKIFDESQPVDFDPEYIPGESTNFYGGKNTWHNRTNYVHVETNSRGKVVAVWFRCRMLPFSQITVDENRQRAMDSSYAIGGAPPLAGVVFYSQN